MMLLAQAAIGGGWGLTEFAIAIVVVAALVALVLLALHQFKIPVPPWVWHAFGIVVVAFVIIMAIRFVASL